MPCYTPPESDNAKESRKVSKLLLVLDSKLGLESDPKIIQWSKAYEENHCDVVVPLLCSRINALSESELERIVYNGRDKESRKLADWWDEHSAFDRNKESDIKIGIEKGVFDCYVCGRKFNRIATEIHYDPEEMDSEGEVSLCDNCAKEYFKILKSKADN